MRRRRKALTSKRSVQNKKNPPKKTFGLYLSDSLSAAGYIQYLHVQYTVGRGFFFT